MSWQIKVPYRHRPDSLADVAVAAHVLPTDEARVARQLVLGEILGGQATTAGQLLDKLEQATPAERRKMLDDARVTAGLPSATEVEFRAQHQQRQPGGAIKAVNDPRPMRVACASLRRPSSSATSSGTGSSASRPTPTSTGRPTPC